MKLKDLKNKKIVFFAAETVPSVSGSGINAFHFAQYLSNYSRSVKIVCFNYNNKLNSNERINQLTIKRILYYNSSLLTKILTFPNLILHYIKEIINCDLCFIYGAYMPGFEIIFLMCFLFRRRSIFQSTLLGDDDLESILARTPLILRSMRKWMFSLTSVYYAINSEFKTSWMNNLGINNPVVLLSPGYDDSKFRPATENEQKRSRQLLEIETDTFVILSSGILIERKGYRRIFEELAKLSIPYLYLIAGSNTQSMHHRSSKQELVEMDSLTRIGNESLGKKLRFLGHYNDMSVLYNACTIFLHGGYQEGTPNAIIEAMACKKPIIMRKLPGLDFLLRNEENVLFYVKPSEISGLINKLHSHPKLEQRISENAYRTVSNQTFCNVAEKILKSLQ